LKILKRFRLFEWHEQTWVPRLLRNAITDYLSVFLGYYKIYIPVVPILADMLKKTGCNKVFDFCSGSGGPLLDIQKKLEEEYGLSITVELSDKFPQGKYSITQTNAVIQYHASSVDVLTFAKPTQAVRTLFTAYHHFRPQAAREILAKAMAQREAIAIFEFSRNHWQHYMLDAFAPFSVLLLNHKIRKKGFWYKFWVYVIPIVPLFTWWDAVVSNLRVYSPAQLKKLIEDMEGGDYRWEIGTMPAGLRFYRLTYLLGWPND